MIGSSENRISYNGNGIATEFAYTFKILEKSDIKVLHVAIDGTETLLVSDYYVDMEKSVVLYPGYAPGAEIPEQNRPPILPVGERLVLYREVPITQESALDKHWPFNVIENGLDKLTIICQQIWDRLQRSFYVSESTSTNFDPKVPIEAGKTFRVKDDGTGFEVTEDPGKVIDGATALLKQTTEQAESANEAATNAQNAAKEVKEIYGDGNFTPLSDLLGGLGTKLKRWGSIFANKVFASNLPIVYNSVAEMKADTMLWEGMSTKTLGYYTPNDGGGASYLVRAKAEADSDEGGSLHQLANGLVAELIIENDTIFPEQFGAKGDAVSDDTIYLQQAIDSGKTVILTRNYLVSNTLNISKQYTNIRGISYVVTKPSIQYFGDDKLFNVTISNFVFRDFNLTSKNVNSGIGIYIRNPIDEVDSLCDNVGFSNFSTAIDVRGRNLEIVDSVFSACNNCVIQNTSITGETRDLNITNCRFHGCGVNGEETTWKNNYCITLANGTQTRNKITNNYFDSCSGVIKGCLAGLYFANNLFCEGYGGDDSANAIIEGITSSGNNQLPFYIGNNFFSSRYSPNANYHVTCFISVNSNGIVTDNIFDKSYGYIIKTSSACIIKNNVITNPPQYSNLIDASNGGVVVTGNIVDGNTDTHSYLLANTSSAVSVAKDNIMTTSRATGNVVPSNDAIVTAEIVAGKTIPCGGCSSISFNMTDTNNWVTLNIPTEGIASGITYYSSNRYFYIVGTVVTGQNNQKQIRVDIIGENNNGEYITGYTASAYALHFN